jgi:hypothetical protein
MAEIINLRRARKAKARSDAAAEADRNRVRHGIPLTERKLAKSRQDRDAADLDGARRVAPPADSPESGRR